jgi:pilus assembly protein CpaB
MLAALGAGFVGLSAGLLLGGLVGMRIGARQESDALLLVLTSVEDIPVGATLTADMIVARELPSEYLEDRHIVVADLERAIGAHTVVALRAGESILWTDLESTAHAPAR